MFTLFIILMILIFGKLGIFALKAAWGVTKLVFFFLFLPVFIIAMVFGGLLYLALPLLIVFGLISLIARAIRGK